MIRYHIILSISCGGEDHGAQNEREIKKADVDPATCPLLATITAGGVILLVVFVAYLSLAAGPEPIVPVASRFYDVKNKLITTVSVENRIELPLKNIPRELQGAFLSVEDERFYQHIGIDPVGIARTIYRNLKAGRIVQGASTITQQLARNVFLSQEVTFIRKFKEISWPCSCSAVTRKTRFSRCISIPFILATGLRSRSRCRDLLREASATSTARRWPSSPCSPGAILLLPYEHSNRAKPGRKSS